MSDIHRILIPGVRIAVEDSGGGGDPLVLLHGLAGDRSLWDFVWNDLSVGKRVLRYDLRGFGESIPLNDTEFQHSIDLLGLLNALKIDRCALVGVSLGGSVALNFALNHAERVRCLTLISPGITAWDWSDDWRVRWQAIVATAQAGDIVGAREQWLAHPLFKTTLKVPQAEKKLRENISAYSGDIWLEGDREVAALPDLDRIPFLKVPTLLLSGEADLPDFRLIADLIEAAAPEVRRVDYEGAGHMLNLERPKEVTAEILSFFG